MAALNKGEGMPEDQRLVLIRALLDEIEHEEKETAEEDIKTVITECSHLWQSVGMSSPSHGAILTVLETSLRHYEALTREMATAWRDCVGALAKDKISDDEVKDLVGRTLGGGIDPTSPGNRTNGDSFPRLVN